MSSKILTSVNDILNREQRRQVKLPQLLERFFFMFGVFKSLVGESSVECTLIHSVANIAHDTLCTYTVVVERLVTAAPKVEDLQGAADWSASPFRVAEVGVSNAKLLKSGDTEE